MMIMIMGVLCAWGLAMGLLLIIIIILYKYRPTPIMKQLVSYMDSSIRISSFLIYEVEQMLSEDDEYYGYTPSHLFSAVHLYLSERLSQIYKHGYDKSVSDVPVLRVLVHPKSRSQFSFSLAPEQTFDDVFEGKKVEWKLLEQIKSHNKPPDRNKDLPDMNDFFDVGQRGIVAEIRRFSLRLKLRKADSHILGPYLRHIMDVSSSKLSVKQLRLHTNLKSAGKRSWYSFEGHNHVWSYVNFCSNVSFDTLAVDPALKESIMQDLNNFVDPSALEFYQNLGRSWKRGYFIHGPPGSGKSDLVAAIANFLGYDIYEIELAAVVSNSFLKNMLLTINSKSVIVLRDGNQSLTTADKDAYMQKKESELHMHRDVDMNGDGCDVDVDDPCIPRVDDDVFHTRPTFSGILNFIDGLWSCCADERIFIFTTENPDDLHSALLRPGRMDMNIQLSPYCTFQVFKILVINYLGLQEHELFEHVRIAMDEKGCRIMTKKVCQILKEYKNDPEEALKRLVVELQNKIGRHA